MTQKCPNLNFNIKHKYFEFVLDLWKYTKQNKNKQKIYDLKKYIFIS